MDIYASDDEKAEALKSWWRENGRSVVTGIVLGGAIIFGWRYWLTHQQSATEQAATIYQQVQMKLTEDDLTQAEDLTQTLMQSHAKTPYAAFAALELAAKQVRAKQPEAALEYLNWAAEKAQLDAQKDLARLRAVRVLTDQEDYEQALQIAQQPALAAYASLFDELQGDIYLAQGQKSEAFAAYRNALSSLNENDPRRTILEMKRDDVAVIDEG